jgi:hypothetical protein
MENIKLHITSFDSETNAMVIFFESIGVANTTPIAYQIHNVFGDTLDEKLLNIAKIGYANINAELEIKRQASNTALKTACSNLVGSVLTYTESQILPSTVKTYSVSDLTDITNS